MLQTTGAGVIVYANRAATGLLGYETRELVGTQLGDLCDDVKKPSSWSRLDGTALWLHTKSGRSIRCVVQSRLHNEHGGRSRCVDLLLVPLNSGGGCWSIRKSLQNCPGPVSSRNSDHGQQHRDHLLEPGDPDHVRSYRRAATHYDVHRYDAQGDRR
ncbi:MAG: PAS domain-containing protein [Acidobacteria bacterium]|nr:PAS domain-containing protein [Acidobacteriota bacterium]